MPEGLERDNFDENKSDLRSHIESAIATHNSGGPDLDSAVNTALEDHSRNIRDRNHREDRGRLQPGEIKNSNQIRHSLRQSIAYHKNKDAAAPVKINGVEAPVGAPVTWSTEAKAEFDKSPHSVKMAALREQKLFAESVQPIVQRHQEFEQVIAPHRERYSAHGISDVEAIQRLFMWEYALRTNPAQAFPELARQFGYGQQQYPQQYQQPEAYDQAYQQSYDAAPQIQNVLTEFSRTHPQFEQVRGYMGQLIQQNEGRYNTSAGFNLELAYSDACEIQMQENLANFARSHPLYEQVRFRMGQLITQNGSRYADGNNINLELAYQDALAGDSSRKRAGAVSMRGRAPSGRIESDRQSVGGVRQSINNAIRELRA